MTFMAPEIRGGTMGDPTCDVYTAGALLYFAVTGQEPALDSGLPAVRPSCVLTAHGCSSA